MTNALVEDWFASLGFHFSRIHLEGKMGVPTVRLEVDFVSPSQLGDQLDLWLVVVKLGQSSCRLAITFACAGQTRLTAQVVLVCMDLTTHQSMPWPDDLRAGMAGHLPA